MSWMVLLIFFYSCCHQKCNGYFGPTSQKNGCHILNQHLFEDENEQKQANDEDVDSQNVDSIFCGKWKVMLWIENRTSLFKICDVEIVKHTKSGNIEGHLIGTLYIDDNKYENCLFDGIYSGQISGDQLMLTYCTKTKASYRESYVLFVEDCQLNGNWMSSTKQRGICQWIKVTPLLKSVCIPIEREESEL